MKVEVLFKDSRLLGSIFLGVFDSKEAVTLWLDENIAPEYVQDYFSRGEEINVVEEVI